MRGALFVVLGALLVLTAIVTVRALAGTPQI